MREIKFRAFCDADGEERRMLYFQAQQFEDGINAWPAPNNIHHIDSYESRLMQYTGFKDLEGVEIYDGDIVDIGGITQEVEYMHFLRNITNTELRRTKVIGNIYEHPVLLTK